MGRSDVGKQDLAQFSAALSEETERLRGWFAGNRFAAAPATAGCELEACLVDEHFAPADANTVFLERLNMPEAVPELARCNIEFNSNVFTLAGRGLEQMHAEMDAWLARGRQVASELGLRLLLIGVLPTLEERHMSLAHISPAPRYRALNQAVARQRGSEQVEIAIRGRQEYRGRYDSIMAESAATSYQLHLRLPPARAARWYNAAMIASGPVLAVAANSPYLFGHDLWAETRVPVFAQAVDTGDRHYVTFGSRYLEGSLFELFAENLAHYPPLLASACTPGGIDHLLLHNGSIWRWNRPVIGLGEPPHLRLEHRALPSGPSVIDMLANCALFFGLVQALGEADPAPEERMPIGAARANFYRAARSGLAAELHWFGRAVPAPDLFRAHLLGLARTGLDALGVAPELAERYLQVITARVARGLSGAGWQRAWVARNGADMAAMLAAYAERQASGAPVSEWPL